MPLAPSAVLSRPRALAVLLAVVATTLVLTPETGGAAFVATADSPAAAEGAAPAPVEPDPNADTDPVPSPEEAPLVAESGTLPSVAADLRTSQRVSPPQGSGVRFFSVDERSVPVAPGLTHTRYDRFDARGWNRVNVLSADLATPGLRVDHVSPGPVTATAPLSTMLSRSRSVAGVNGDFFDITDTGAPLGVGRSRGRGLLHAPERGWNQALLVSGKGRARIASTHLKAHVQKRGGRKLPVSNLNSPAVRANGIGLYNSFWGAASRKRVVTGRKKVRQVRIRGGRVRENSRRLGAGQIGKGVTVLVGVGKGARRLSNLKKGNRVAVTYGLDNPARVALSGNTVILKDGKVLGGDPVLHPRTSIGIDATGTRVFVVTVDGRASQSIGVTLGDVAQVLRRLGATDALNLDGGGSSTMMARPAGQPVRTVNQPSDGRQRRVPNGLGFRVTSGSTDLAGFRVEPVQQHVESARVLRGLSRVLVAHPFNGRYAGTAGTPAWRTDARASTSAGRSARAVVVGKTPGTSTVEAYQGSARGTLDLEVLGVPRRLEPSVGRIAFGRAGDSRYIEVWGYDQDGFGTWVEPRDVQLAFDRAVVSVSRSGRGFLVRARRTDATTTVRFTAGGVSTAVGTTAGLRRQGVHQFNRAGQWRAAAVGGSVRLAGTTNRRDRAGKALAVRYGFRRSAAVRGKRLVRLRHAGIALPRGTRQVRMWIRGDGKGAAVRLEVRPRSGGATTFVTAAPRVSWRGWRQVTATVPSALRQPADVVGVRLVPGRSGKHRGTLALDQMDAGRPHPTPRLTALPSDDRVLSSRPAVSTGARIAVLGDARVSSAAPQGPAANALRSALRDARASRVDQVLLTGDLVAGPTRAHLTFVRDLLNAELGPVPWRWVPGDRERGSDLAAYRAVLGDPVGTFDRAGVRFVALNSSARSLRLGGFDQLLRLRTGLTRAAAERSIDAVVVVGHHPTRALVAGAAPGLADRREGEVVESLLENAHTAGGKPVAHVSGHGRRFQAVDRDGVAMVATGPVSGKPAGPSAGAFRGWTLLDVHRGDLRVAFVPTS
ncbi:MAG: phosphodiester glycosidase family protein [Nocardioides sp.]|nr:phosphodiester glycosidase family protein [Nocardioides sp.]